MKYYKKSILVIILFISIAITLSSNINTVAATSQSTIYVSTTGHDTWDGKISTWNGVHGPKKTIKNAVKTVRSGGTIQIASGTYHEHGININKKLIINGASKKTTRINSMYQNTILTINSGVTVKISNLILDRGKNNIGGAIYNEGKITLINTSFTNNRATKEGGGAIYNKHGSINIVGSSFICNSAKSGSTGTFYGGAIYNLASAVISTSTFSNNTAISGGGSIFNIGGLTVTNSNFTNNHVTAGGGAIRNAKGTLTINHCKFIGNKAIGGGGAVINLANKNLKNPSSSTMNIQNSIFKGNTAANGGAIDNYYGKLTTNYCTLTSNSATKKGGAILNSYGILSIINSNASNNIASTFGGMLFSCGPVTISKSNFKNNKVTNGSGGVIYNFDYNVNIFSSTFTGNTARGTGPNDQGYGGCIHSFLGTISIDKSSFTGNSATTGGGAIVNDGGSYLSIKNSLFTKNSAISSGRFGNGGAIFSYGSYGCYNSTISVYNTIFIGNTAKTGGRGGGAIEAFSGTDNQHSIATINKCQFYNNTATYGGAIQTQFGTLTVTNSVFKGNKAIYNGGAILTLHEKTTIKYNNITNNQASNYGSAIYNSGHDINVHNNNIIANPGNNQIYCPNTLYTPINAKYFVYAQNNWWGSDNDPSKYVQTSGNSVIVDNWLHKPY